MANFYYVKSGGTAAQSTDDGRVATTRSTGSFATKGASNYWDSIIDALTATTVPTAGDFIMCSDAHNKVHTITQTWLIPNGVTIISVADANLDQYAIGASEVCDNSGTTIDSTIELVQQKEASIFGLTFGAEDDFNFRGVGAALYCQDCTFNVLAASNDNFIQMLSDGLYVMWKNCTVNFTHITGQITVGSSGTLEIDGLTSTGTKVDDLLGGLGNTGATIIIRNSDLSQVMAASGDIVETLVGTEDYLDLYIENCKLPTSFRLTEPTMAYPNHKVVLSGCGVADEYFHFETEENFNVVIQDLVTYLYTTYDGSNFFSTKITTQSKIAPYYPYRYLLGIITAQDLSIAKTITVELTSDASLTDLDIWLEITRQDATDQTLGVVVSTQNTADLLAAAGANLSTSRTGVWTSPDTENYIITKDLGAIAAATNVNVQVWACMGKASISANFDQPTIANT